MSSAVRRHSSATKASPVPAVSTATVPANRGGRLPLSGRSTSMRAWSRRVGLGRRRLLTHSFREPHAHGLVACRQQDASRTQGFARARLPRIPHAWARMAACALLLLPHKCNRGWSRNSARAPAAVVCGSSNNGCCQKGHRKMRMSNQTHAAAFPTLHACSLQRAAAQPATAQMPESCFWRQCLLTGM